MTRDVDAKEIAKFEAMAREWWDPNGKFKPLHKMNPCRLGYIVDQIYWHFDRDANAPSPMQGLSVLDVGCGGGLLCEPLARLGSDVTGIDGAPTNIEVAKLHAEAQDLKIEYQNILAEDLEDSAKLFDVVLAMEIIEHVASPQSFVQTLVKRLKPGGLIVMSTLNRNSKSYLFAIIGAEYVLQWLPKGTHDWNKFITPDELSAMFDATDAEVFDRVGMVYNPARASWSRSHRDLSVNYALAARKP